MCVSGHLFYLLVREQYLQVFIIVGFWCRTSAMSQSSGTVHGESTRIEQPGRFTQSTERSLCNPEISYLRSMSDQPRTTRKMQERAHTTHTTGLQFDLTHGVRPIALNPGLISLSLCTVRLVHRMLHRKNLTTVPNFNQCCTSQPDA